MGTVLLTAFEPFDHDLINPSWEAVRLLDGVQLQAGVTIIARQLPCAFDGIGINLGSVVIEFAGAIKFAHSVLIIVQDHDIHSKADGGRKEKRRCPIMRETIRGSSRSCK